MSFFAFDALPIELQQRLNAGEMVSIIKENKPFAVIHQDKPSYAKGDFDYDLERMKKAVEAPYVVMPKFNNDDDFFAWVENLTDDDFISEKV